MGFRFRRSVRLFPGVRVNFGLRGVSVSAGVPGMTVNIGPRRSSITVGIPGTGLSYTETLGPARRPVRSPPPVGNFVAEPPAAPIDRIEPGGVLPGEIRSAEVAALTSPDLEGLKKLINEAAHQKASLQSDWLEAVSARKKAWKKLRRREQLPLRLFMKQAIPKAREAFDEAENEARKVAEALAASEIKVEVVLDDRCWAAWSRLEQAHRRLSNSARFWDVTSSLVVDRFRTRSAASFEVTRRLVGLRPITDGILSGPHRGMRFENANGDDLDIFPGFLLIRQKQGTDYALVDLRDLDTRSYPQQFIEAEGGSSAMPERSRTRTARPIDASGTTTRSRSRCMVGSSSRPPAGCVRPTMRATAKPPSSSVRPCEPFKRNCDATHPTPDPFKSHLRSIGPRAIEPSRFRHSPTCGRPMKRC